jgi:hypothetical protein
MMSEMVWLVGGLSNKIVIYFKHKTLEALNEDGDRQEGFVERPFKVELFN